MIMKMMMIILIMIMMNEMSFYYIIWIVSRKRVIMLMKMKGNKDILILMKDNIFVEICFVLGMIKFNVLISLKGFI